MPAQERPRSYSSDLTTSSPNFFRPPVADVEAFTPTDNLSSLESDEPYVPVSLPIIPYEPIPIPREPTLEEILRTASGDYEELDQVKHLKLCVISENMSLQRVAAFCPLLTSLNLEGSALSTLRDLGCMMTCLRYLDVSRCGLRSLDGTSGLGSVTHLVANNNQIEYLDPCSFLDELQELSVQGNRIRTRYNLSCLSLCPLRTLHIDGNPIEEIDNFQNIARDIIPKLIFLNGVQVREEPEENRCADDSVSSNTESSHSSGSFSSLDKSIELYAAATTTTSAPPESVAPDSNNASTSTSFTTRRPESAGKSQSSVPPIPTQANQGHGMFTEAAPLSRRPLSAGLIRLREKRRSLSQYLLPEFDDTDECIFDKQFPLRLPQVTPSVELELGVIGRVLERSKSATTTDVLHLAQQWREFRRNHSKRPESAKGRLAGYDVIRLSGPSTPATIDELSELSVV